MADTTCPPAVKYGVPICSAIAILLIIILVVASLATLEPTEVAFSFDQNTQTINLDTLYGPGGRHFIGLGKRFVKYPTKLLLLEFSDRKGADAASVSVFVEGQEIVISCSLMVTLNQTQLSLLYRKFGENKYKSIFIRTAVTALKDVASRQFTREDYFKNRAAVGEAFKKAVQTAYVDIYGTVTFFQLRRINLPPSLETEISKNIVTSQQTKTSQAEQTATLIRKQTEVEIAGGLLKLNQLQSFAKINNSNAILIAQAEAKETVLRAEAQALLGARLALGLKSNESSVLINWLYQRALQNLNSTDLWIGFNSFTQTLPAGSN